MMDEKKVEEMYRAVMETNRMVHGMRRSAMVGGIIKAVFWIFALVVLPYLTWLYVQPYLEGIMTQYQTIQQQSGMISAQAEDLQKQLNSFGSFDLQSLFQQFTGGGQE